MEQPMRCKTLTAIYKNEINTLKKLYEIDFLIHKSVRIHIEQFTVRKIEIDFTSEQLVDDLMNLISIEFQASAGCVPPNLKECAEHFMRRRLAYFHSNKILFSSNYLLDFSKVLTPALYEKWKGILEDLDVAHQVYLYSLCDTNQPVDLRCAFLIELAEPVVEIVKANSPLFESLNPGKQGTSLRDCLRALITTYGSDIFENEINSCFETFLKSLVNSRVRIICGDFKLFCQCRAHIRIICQQGYCFQQRCHQLFGRFRVLQLPGNIVAGRLHVFDRGSLIAYPHFSTPNILYTSSSE